MERLTSSIIIGKISFNAVTQVDVESSWDTFTDTATITLPRKLRWKGKDVILGKDPVFKKGDPVLISLGYDDHNDRVFQGYVTSVSATIPAVIECQDAMWLLKQKKITKTYKAVTLRQLLSDLLLSTIPYEAPSVSLGPIRISNASVAKVLDMLKSKYMLRSFIRDGKLYCGLAYWPEIQTRHKLRFDTHIPENSLKYIKSDDVSIKLTIVVVDENNEKKEYNYGDPDGEQRTLFYYEITKAQVDHIASQEIERLKIDGYQGDITTFGKPYVQHGDVVDLVDDFYPDRNGSYLVKSRRSSYGLGGYRQVIELDEKIGDD